MKKLLLTAAAIMATLNIYAQGSGTVTFSTSGQTDPNKLIWVNDTGELGVGQRAPGGTTGPYNVALYWAPAGTTDERQFARLGAAGGLQAAGGTFNLFARTITTPGSTVNGPVVAFQIRGWTTANGNDYDVVRNSGQGWVGKNPIWEMKTKDETVTTELRPFVWEIRSGVPNPAFFGFAITPVPEPSVIGLGLLGVGALLMLRRRK